MDPKVKEYVQQKYNLAKEVEEAQKKAAEYQFSDDLARAGATIGSAFGGTEIDKDFWNQQAARNRQVVSDAIARQEAADSDFQRQRRDIKAAEEDKELERNAGMADPNNKLAQLARTKLKDMGWRVDDGMSLLDMRAAGIDAFKVLLDDKKHQEDLENKKEERSQRSLDRQAVLGQQAFDREQKRLDKLAEKEEKKKQTVMEIEDRRRNIEDNLTELEMMVGSKGTWEAVGSHNQDLDRKIDQIATDMAKLQDPNSVARPSEVDMVKKNLIQSGFQNSNATALNILKNFRKEVTARAANAYKIRGLDDPGSSSPSNDTVRVQAPDGSIKRIPKDKVDAAIKAGGKKLD